MRLLDVRTLRVLEFNNDAIPPYAILSHTWGEEEITYQDLNPQLDQIYSQIKAMGNFLKAKNGYQFSSQVRTKKGFLKVEQAAKRALSDRYDYIWIDTCCIDKSSSAELSEAINSMYQWYQNAGVCYAFLSDVSTYNSGRALQEASIWNSRWFTRGWTLQELIAPKNMQFYSAEWDFLGSKHGSQNDSSSVTVVGPRILGEITGIDERVLDGSLGPQELSVATRMSWAALRQTTRVEDRAYCLLGVFSVNMPLLYGEGSRAFVRLQEAIMRETDDQSIFAWAKTMLPSKGITKDDELSGLLADSPLHFLKSTGVRPLPPLLSGETMPTTISNQGLNLKLYLRPIPRSGEALSSDRFYAILDCSRIFLGVESSPAIYLKRLWGNQYARILPDSIQLVKPPGLEVPLAEEGYRTVNVRQNPVHLVPDFNVNPDALGPRRVTAAYPRNRWDSSAWILKSTYAQVGGVMGIIELEDLRSGGNSGTITVFVGIEGSSGAQYKPWCMAVRRQGGFSTRSLFEVVDESARNGRLLPNMFGPQENVCVAQVSEIVRHGRSYVSLTVEDVPELGSYHFQQYPALDFAPAREIAGSADCAGNLARVFQSSIFEDFGASSLLDGSFVGKRVVRIRPVEQLLSYSNDLLQKVPDQIQTDMQEEMFDLEDQQKAEKLLKCCRDGELHMIKAMGSIRTLVGVKTVNFFGFTALHWAVFGGHVELAEYLLDQGASMMPGTEFKPDCTTLAPIHLIAILGQDAFLGTLQKLFETNSEWLNLTTSPYLDSLPHLVVVSDRFSDSLLRALTSKRIPLTYSESDPNMLGEQPMHRAAATRNTRALAFLLEECKRNLNSGNYSGASGFILMPKWVLLDHCQRSPVWHAAASGFADGILLMYQKLTIIRGYLDHPDDMGLSPLHIACRQGHEAVVEVLLSLGVKPDGKVTLGLTPAHFAAFFGHPACLQKMSHHGIEMDTPAVHFHGLRPLHLAALRGQLECVEVLSRSGANQRSLAYAVFETHKEWWKKGDIDEMEWRELDSPMTPIEMAVLKNHSLVTQRLAFWSNNPGMVAVPHRKRENNDRVFVELPV